MVQESSQAPQARVTQIQVRVDCNGCVQKIKKALNGIHGIHDLRVDIDRQRLTIIGWADPEKVVQAIKKKTKKNATICSNMELLASSSKPTQPKQKRNATAPPFATTQPTPPEEAIPARAGPSSEPPSPTQHNARRQQWQNNLGGTKHVGQVHMTQHPHHQANYVNRFSSYGNSYIDHSDRSYHDSPVFQQEPSQSMYVTHHSYNTYMPSSYVTEYECVRSPSWHTHYNHMEQHYSGGDYQNGNVNIAAMFSDDNPNSCSIV